MISENEESISVNTALTEKYKATAEKVMEYELKIAMYEDRQKYLST